MNLKERCQIFSSILKYGASFLSYIIDKDGNFIKIDDFKHKEFAIKELEKFFDKEEDSKLAKKIKDEIELSSDPLRIYMKYFNTIRVSTDSFATFGWTRQKIKHIQDLIRKDKGFKKIDSLYIIDLIQPKTFEVPIEEFKNLVEDVKDLSQYVCR